MKIIERGIQALREALGQMASAAQDALDLALEALRTGRAEDAQRVREADLRINEFELRLDHTCASLLALQEPYAVDFRFIFASIKTTQDLERMGDEAKLLARWAARRARPASAPVLELGRVTRELVADAVVALRTSSMERARAVLLADRAIDDLEAHILASTQDVAEAFMAHALERIGDRAKNVCENVIYTVSAEDVRHRAEP